MTHLSVSKVHSLSNVIRSHRGVDVYIDNTMPHIPVDPTSTRTLDSVDKTRSYIKRVLTVLATRELR